MDDNRLGIMDLTKTHLITMKVMSTEYVTPVIIAGMLGTMERINGVEFTDLTIQTQKRRQKKSTTQKFPGSEND